MSENEYEEHNLKHEHECFCKKHPLMSHILVGLLILTGAFLAFYVVADWHYKQMFNPFQQMKKMEKMMMLEEQAMHKMMQKDFRMEKATESFIRLDETPNSYLIIVNLKPFNSNPENVSVTIDDNVITVNASNEHNKKNSSKILSVSQSYIFPIKVNFDKLSKERQGDKYIITIPFAN